MLFIFGEILCGKLLLVLLSSLAFPCTSFLKVETTLT